MRRMFFDKLNIFDKLYSYLVYSDEDSTQTAIMMNSRKKKAINLSIVSFFLSLIPVGFGIMTGGLSLLLEIPAMITMAWIFRAIALEQAAQSRNRHHWLLKWFHAPNYIVSPTSSVRLLVMLSAWALDVVLSPFRALEYLIKEKTNPLDNPFEAAVRPSNN